MTIPLSQRGVSSPCLRLQPRRPASFARCQHVHVHSAVSPAAVTEDTVFLGRKGQLSSRYLEGSPIGKGSFGLVYRAVDLRDGTEVAIKQLQTVDAPGRGLLTRGKIQEKIAREMGILQALSGVDRVAQLLDVFDDGRSVHFALELCRGADLQKVSETCGPLSERAVQLVAFEVLSTVKACHERGIQHGDVKPANFCLMSAGRNPLFSMDSQLQRTTWLKAIDFGCSQRFGTQRLTKRTGTPVYMAPEVFSRDYSSASDVWSAGVLLYQLFTGGTFPFWRVPGCAKVSKLDEVANAVINNEITYNFGPFTSMSEEGLDFMQRCLSRTEKERMTIDEALSHPWLTSVDVDEPYMKLVNGQKSGASGNNILPSPLGMDRRVPAMTAAVAVQ